MYYLNFALSTMTKQFYESTKHLHIMKNLKNKVSLIGRLGAQPEVTTLEQGRKMARFSIAINTSYKDKSGGFVKDTQWHTVNAWGVQAERVAKLLQKGQEIMIEGRLNNRSWETKTGERRNTTNIDLTEFLLIGSKPE